MFGIGYQEMVLIGVVALLIFGPQRLPEMASQLGKWVRDFRRMSADLTSEFEDAMSEVDEVKKSVQREFGSMSKEVAGVSKSVDKDLKKKGTAAKPAAKTGTARAIGGKTNGAAAGSQRQVPTKALAAANGQSANGKATLAATVPMASKADPLADVSFLDDSLFTRKNGHAEAIAETVVIEAPTVDPALLRMRQRRASAGYRRG